MKADEKWIGCMVKITTYDKVQDHVKETGMKMRAVIERALLEYVKKHSKKE